MATIFRWDAAFKEEAVVKFEDVSAQDNFYDVDKVRLEQSATKESRLSQLYLKVGEEDTTMVSKLRKVISAVVATTTVPAKPTIKINHLEGQNSAALSGEEINVSFNSMYDFRVPLFVRANNVVANAFHEALHIQHTTPGIVSDLISLRKTITILNRFGKKQQVADFAFINELFDNGNSLYMQCHNIIEDRRIESLGVKKAPGYVYYLEESRKYALFLHYINIKKNHTNKNLSDVKSLWDTVFLYALYKVLLPEIVPFFIKQQKLTKEFNELMEKVDDIVKRTYLDFSSAKHQSYTLYKLFPKEYSNTFKNAGAAIFIGTPMSSDKVGSPKELQQAFESSSSAVTKEKKQDLSKIPNGFKHINSIIEKQAETSFADFNVFISAQQLSKTLSKNFSFVDAKFNRTIDSYELATGMIEEGDLALASKNKFVFFEEDEIPHYNLDFGVLVDESGSMSGGKIEKAKTAAIALTLALNQNKFINLFVWGHSANTRDNRDGVLIYNYYNSESSKANINTLFGIEARSNNADGFAINYVGEFLLKRHTRKKVLVVISDGAPHADGYGGAEAVNHTRQMVETLESRGVYVIQIAIDSFESSKMFKNFIAYSPDSLGAGLKKILSKQLVEIANQI